MGMENLCFASMLLLFFETGSHRAQAGFELAM